MVYVVEFTDYTIADGSCILGIYDNANDAEKRAKEYTETYIKSDEQGPLGKAEVIAYRLNEAVPGNAGEAYTWYEHKED